MLNNSHNLFFYLVERVSTFINSNLISQNLGKTLVLKWTIEKCEWCKMYLEFCSQRCYVIQWLFIVLNNQIIKSDFAKKKFGDRINVTWVGRNFKVELKYLQSNDTGNFTVYRYCSERNVSSYKSCILITEAQGMYRFIWKCMRYDIVCLGTS